MNRDTAIEIIVKAHTMKEGRLDYWVAKVLGIPFSDDFKPTSDWSQGGKIIQTEGIDLHQIKSKGYQLFETRHFRESLGDVIKFMPSFGKDMIIRPKPPGKYEGQWLARMSTDHHPFGWEFIEFRSPTPLIAAMRCLIVSKLCEKYEVTYVELREKK